MSVVFTIELERETDGRWMAEVVELPGILAYGATQDETIAFVQALALRVVADRLDPGLVMKGPLRMRPRSTSQLRANTGLQRRQHAHP